MTERDEAIDALLWEIHAQIEDASRSVLSGIGSDLSPIGVTYPPGEKLTGAERDALRDLQLSHEQRSGLFKLIVDAGGSQFFRAFCLIDGVGDPEQFPVSEWLGLCIQPAAEETEQPEMLHDVFFDSWRDWKGGAKQRRTRNE